MDVKSEKAQRQEGSAKQCACKSEAARQGSFAGFARRQILRASPRGRLSVLVGDGAAMGHRTLVLVGHRAGVDDVAVHIHLAADIVADLPVHVVSDLATVGHHVATLDVPNHVVVAVPVVGGLAPPHQVGAGGVVSEGVEADIHHRRRHLVVRVAGKHDLIGAHPIVDDHLLARFRVLLDHGRGVSVDDLGHRGLPVDRVVIGPTRSNRLALRRERGGAATHDHRRRDRQQSELLPVPHDRFPCLHPLSSVNMGMRCVRVTELIEGSLKRSISSVKTSCSKCL